jgi:hypothetical protein
MRLENTSRESHTKLDIGNGEGNLLLVLDAVEKRGQAGSDLALHDGGSLLQSCGSTVELLEALQLETRGFVSDTVADNKNLRPPSGWVQFPLRILSGRIVEHDGRTG